MTSLEFVVLEGNRKALIELKNGSQSPTPLHAEAQGLIWEMKTLKQRGYRAIHFETDCAQLLKLIQKLEEWPSMANEMEEITLNSNLVV